MHSVDNNNVRQLSPSQCFMMMVIPFALLFPLGVYPVTPDSITFSTLSLGLLLLISMIGRFSGGMAVTHAVEVAAFFSKTVMLMMVGFVFLLGFEEPILGGIAILMAGATLLFPPIASIGVLALACVILFIFNDVGEAVQAFAYSSFMLAASLTATLSLFLWFQRLHAPVKKLSKAAVLCIQSVLVIAALFVLWEFSSIAFYAMVEMIENTPRG